MPEEMPKVVEKPAHKPREANASHASVPKSEYIKIVIAEKTDAAEQPIVDVSIQGRRYLLTPGMEVAVPPEVLGVLDNAVEDRQVKNKITGNYETRKVKRYTYRRV